MKKGFKDGLSVKLVPIENFQMTGVLQITKVGDYGMLINGQMNRLPVAQEVTLQIMEYGDLSSIIVEYPDYNSLGQSLMKLNSYTISSYTIEATRMSNTFNLSVPFETLAGRSLIATTKSGDLVAYGIIVNE